MRSFYWLVPDVLAGCGRPGHRVRTFWRAVDATSPNGLAALDEDLAWLRERGIAAILSLTETPLAAAIVARHDLAVLHVPVDDMTAPSPEQLDLALSFIDRQRALDHPVAVHCLMGQGRTGTILAAYLIRDGLDPDAAVQRVRAVCPGAVESAEQRRALYAFSGRRDWIV